MWDMLVSVPDHCLCFYFPAEFERPQHAPSRAKLGAHGYPSHRFCFLELQTSAVAFENLRQCTNTSLLYFLPRS